MGYILLFIASLGTLANGVWWLNLFNNSFAIGDASARAFSYNAAYSNFTISAVCLAGAFIVMEMAKSNRRD